MVWGYLKSELQALPLEPDHTYSVGRKLDSDLVLKVRRRSALPPVMTTAITRAPTTQSRSVSGEHGVIEVDVAGKRAVLRDLHSLNGCFVNNVRIKGQREALSHGGGQCTRTNRTPNVGRT